MIIIVEPMIIEIITIDIDHQKHCRQLECFLVVDHEIFKIEFDTMENFLVKYIISIVLGEIQRHKNKVGR